MKSKLLFIALGALTLLSACTKDPWADVEKGEWNNDHKILDIKFSGQAGKAAIKEVDETTGTITVQLVSNLVTDKSKVGIEVLDLSYKSKADVERGQTMDFSGDAPTIKVTSATGKSRVYTIDMTEFTEPLIGKYAITGSKIWGGTGPMYGGSALFDPVAKASCWNSEGYGPAAEYDDYLEFTLEDFTPDGNPTGKCIHYGGVDGKHWNCLFMADQNPLEVMDIDVHKWYRKIPVGESTWTHDVASGNIIFTAADGTVSKGVMVEAGEYQVYKDETRDMKITVEKKAFLFTITLEDGAADDWTNIYSNYDMLVARPRAYFVMVEPVDGIPSASATEGTEGKNTVTPPDDTPEEALDLAGDWEVKELWVYGGASGCVTKDKAESKSWCWNNCNNELDNILSFTPSAEGSLSGKLNYTAGADGRYWDYMYVGNKAGVPQNIDCSEWYGWLPHAETSYTYNPKDESNPDGGVLSVKMKGVLSYNVPLLLPGEYVFLGKSKLVISDNCIALALPLSESASPDTTYQWTDYDRFVHSPLLYVMVFEKLEAGD